MKKILAVTLLVLLVAAFLQAETKIAYINSDVVLENSNDGQRVQTIISTFFTPISASRSYVIVSQQSKRRALSPDTSTPVLTAPVRI